MDPLTMMAAALAAGAAAGLKPAAEQAVKDAYAGVKAFIQAKYRQVDLTSIERTPESEANRESVRTDLAHAGAEHDQELLARIVRLVDSLEHGAPMAAAAIGVDLNEVKAASLKVRKVVSEGTAVKVHKSEFTGDIELGEIRAGTAKPPENP